MIFAGFITMNDALLMSRFLSIRKLGLEYTLENTKPPSEDLIERACALFWEVGLKAY
jgi:hypothetical protein